MKTLIIAEKPSVAGDIARALGGCRREKDYYEGEDYVISSAVGHLLEMIAPEGAEVKRGKWLLKNLPVLPERFDLVPIKSGEPRLRVLARLYKRSDIGAVINACDAGREGELIFYNLLRYLNKEKSGKKENKGKTVQRLWLSSMTPAAIRRGFADLRKNEELENLRRAAVCRAEADWLIGINSTRAMTALHSASGNFFLTTVGRVQTPTLALLVEREQQIKAFQPQSYREVYADFVVAAGAYRGIWVHGEQNQSADKQDKVAKPERIFNSADASVIIDTCRGQTGQATETVKPASEIAPQLFDLTSLQRQANVRFGMSARGVLATAQALYEKHKMITYPRTDSRCLPQDYPAVVKKTLTAFAADAQLGLFARQVIDNNWVIGKNKRLFNDVKVSDHFAIIPTGEGIEKKSRLRENERKIYDFICRRFIAAFFPPAKFLVTKRTTMVKDHQFLTKGKVLTEPGWRAVAAPQTADKDDNLIALADGGEEAAVAEIWAEEKITQPPPRYSEATLLSAMESAGKKVEDEELRDAMRERGLGTPATRATIIEGLVRENYLVRDRRDLIPTPKAHSLLRLLSALKADALTEPALTGDWEYKLRRIEKAEGDDTTFMREIRTLTSTIVNAAQNCGDIENINSKEFATLTARCPQCGAEVKERHRRFSCADKTCGFFIWKAMGGREFSAEEIEGLLVNGSTAELEGFRSRLGREFSAAVKLNKEEGSYRVAFAFDDATPITSIDVDELRQKPVMGNCPKCGAPVHDNGDKYLCEQAVGSEPACDFSFNRRVLQREIPPEQIQQLLTAGKTALLDNFISRKTRRPFKAYLKMDLEKKDGKLLFEFEPRAAAKKTAARKPKAKKAAAKRSAVKKN